ncbi:MAG: SDR family NAD(P)-dependent oxidoreductase [Myxococcota bacterium]|nr:SDR family NAD(P)-dependent oxidoreductase [Myxococcota bacterium]
MNHVTVVTGASSGIGAELAKQLASAGHSVALLARRKDELMALADDIIRAGGRAEVFPVDVADRGAVVEAMKEIESRLGPITTLVANAGIGDSTPANGFRSDKVERIIRVNLLGVVYCIEYVLPGMLERDQGHIVGIGSLAGYRGLPGSAGYCASKAGLAALLESLRIELQSTEVSVTTICPGFVKTPLTARNHHPMPFILELDDATRRIVRAMAKKRTEYAFPWPLAFTVKLARFIPNRLYDRILKNQSAQKEPSSTN